MYYTFVIKKPAGSNYTPADLMKQYAGASEIAQYSSRMGRAVLTVRMTEYGFDHWEIHKEEDGSETITVTLFRIET